MYRASAEVREDPIEGEEDSLEGRDLSVEEGIEARAILRIRSHLALSFLPFFLARLLFDPKNCTQFSQSSVPMTNIHAHVISAI